ncbi:DUF1315 domain-containing protein [Moritella viscosa]|uniref:General negative regulator of transcription subunit 1 n=1 Tax=Moritella viscosa TaxID=80854 RepID=A0A1K9ZQU6_9GAMM|nr:DUF1315 domain-containing protein [Moritella viscosa]SGY95188.1 General negative regulator of transcription subunit 1 [Moritella viscosa]SGZ00515.1 General negative regulator of transcription subunit 1 [Moritella viscosa]SGZ00937.1 General negative regulator of transcription subunit 1 [Moritella viscosa]SGZ07040.1 General negative regulator of transcription subunit 1 [Moritella viscosa]SGZ07165.1 General negative regulator of transcription subunit 1 [Moritella viscosa]
MFEQVSVNLPQAICYEFRQALIQGCWKSGLLLTEQQRRICEQVLFYHEGNDSNCNH